MKTKNNDDMPLDAALEFAESGRSSGGMMTHEALRTLATTIRNEFQENSKALEHITALHGLTMFAYLHSIGVKKPTKDIIKNSSLINSDGELIFVQGDGRLRSKEELLELTN